jgi:hypothetical protein
MKRLFVIVEIFVCTLVLSFFFSCLSTPIVNNELLGTWFCKLSTGETMEISLRGNNYSIKIDDVDNNKGTFILTRRYGHDYIVFNIKEFINKRNRWEKVSFLTSPQMNYSYKIENGNWQLIGGVYAGVYTKNATAQTPQTPQAAGDGYFVNISGNRAGPYSMDELRQFVTSGQINKETLVWKEGMLQWQQADMVTELSDLWRSLPPPLPPR